MNDESANSGEIHVVLVGPFDLASPGPVTCSTLSGDVCVDIRNAVNRPLKYRQAGARLFDLRTKHQLGGLVVWFFGKRTKDSVTVPPPFTVPFEPLELNEFRTPLHDLPGLAESTAEAERMRCPIWRRGFVRLGIPAFVMSIQLINAIIQIAVHRTLWIVSLWVAIFAVVALGVALRYWLSDQWFLVPGGVLLRKTLAGKIGETLWLFTPRDSVAVIQGQGRMSILEIWRERSVRRRYLTGLEIAAFLAAWRSPLSPPPIDRLSDWR